MPVRILVVFGMIFAFFFPAYADERPPQDNKPPVSQDAGGAGAVKASKVEDLAVTSHSIKVGGLAISYTATAGYLVLKDEAGKEKANIFFTAYTKAPQADPGKRPITFAFNGGPGASSVWLHLGAIGPKRVVTSPAAGPAPPYRLADNDYSWLSFTDLVFIDPVGTGFSRPASGENAKQFFGTKEDTQSMGDFIRLYASRFGRWGSPKFLAGESYGSFRAVALAQYLYEHFGMDVNGLILVSPALNFQTFSAELGNDLPYALQVPAYTATAWYHHKLSPELQQDLGKTLEEVENWVVHDYWTALMLGDSVSGPEKEKIVQGLARYTGLQESYIEGRNLRIPRSGFLNELLRGENLSVSLMDGRETHFGHGSGFYDDPAMVMTIGPYTATLNEYMHSELKVVNDLPYVFLAEEANSQWNYGSGPRGYASVMDDLQRAIQRTKTLKVFAACGYFDLNTSYFGSRYVLTHLDLNESLRSNIHMATYEGGHMLYTYEPSLRKLSSDVMEFFKTAVHEP